MENLKTVIKIISSTTVSGADSIYRIEPHGAESEEIFKTELLDDKLRSRFGSRYKGILNMRGLQARQDEEYTASAYAGFCFPWCIFMIDYICSTGAGSLPALLTRLPSMFRREHLTDFIADYTWNYMKDFYDVQYLHRDFQTVMNDRRIITQQKPIEIQLEVIMKKYEKVCPAATMRKMKKVLLPALLGNPLYKNEDRPSSNTWGLYDQLYPSEVKNEVGESRASNRRVSQRLAQRK